MKAVVLAAGAELVVSINEDLYDKFDDISIEILFSQEIDKITIIYYNLKSLILFFFQLLLRR